MCLLLAIDLRMSHYFGPLNLNPRDVTYFDYNTWLQCVDRTSHLVQFKCDFLKFLNSCFILIIELLFLFYFKKGNVIYIVLFTTGWSFGMWSGCCIYIPRFKTCLQPFPAILHCWSAVVMFTVKILSCWKTQASSIAELETRFFFLFSFCMHLLV